MADAAQPIPLHETPPAAALLGAAAERDVTPPVGIYNRLWGAAKHDVAQGIHRPLKLGVMVFRSLDEPQDASPFVLASIDASWFRTNEDDREIRGSLVDELQISEPRILVSLTHTHASCSLSRVDENQPGGELIAPYRRAIRLALLDATREALKNLAPATLTWASGRCALAGNRNMPDPERPRLLCGFNPLAQADDTVLVGRMTRDADQRVIGTVVNYACHPTTLAWENERISPDFIGAMREVIQRETADAPCLFLQGASGDLGPREQYTGDTAIADGNGRYLGFSALAALASMKPPGHRLSYRGPVESGAPLAVWRAARFALDRRLDAKRGAVSLPLKKLPTEKEVESQLASCTDRVIGERLRRLLHKVQALRGATHTDVPIWFWRLGTTLFVATQFEPFSDLQLTLRAAFPDHAVVVMNVTNGLAAGYLCPPEVYDGPEIYQVVQSPFVRDAYPVFVESCRQGLLELAR